jgi:Transcription factor WhiB
VRCIWDISDLASPPKQARRTFTPLRDAPPTDAPAERPGRIEYLFLTPVQRDAKERLDTAIDNLPENVRLRCRNPEVRDGRLYFPHMDYDERTPPDAFTAQMMCWTSGKPCPVTEECLAYALLTEPTVGVWGGTVFIDGVPQGITNNKEKND